MFLFDIKKIKNVKSNLDYNFKNIYNNYIKSSLYTYKLIDLNLLEITYVEV